MDEWALHSDDAEIQRMSRALVNAQELSILIVDDSSANNRKDKNLVNSVYVCDSVSVCAIILMLFFHRKIVRWMLESSVNKSLVGGCGCSILEAADDGAAR